MTGRGQLPAHERARPGGPGHGRARPRGGRADYDVVVVGAGPAGSAAAIGMALSGWRVLLVDKATFPRDKVCGDFLSPRSLTALGQLGCWEAVSLAQPYSIRRSVVHLNGELISAGAMPEMAGLPGYGLVIPRMIFDEILFRRAEQAGAKTAERFEVEQISVGAHGVTVSGQSSGRSQSFASRLVIIADGARSQLASSLGVAPRRDGRRDLFALRAYYDGVASDPGTAAIFFDEAYFPGYAWMFPVGGGRANVGMGMVMDVSRRYGINVRERFVHWLAEDPGSGSCSEVRAWMAGSWGGRCPPTADPTATTPTGCSWWATPGTSLIRSTARGFTPRWRRPAWRWPSPAMRWPPMTWPSGRCGPTSAAGGPPSTSTCGRRT